MADKPMTAEEDHARFQKTEFPSFPPGVHVTDRTLDLLDVLKEKWSNRPPGAEKDEYLAAGRALVDQVKGQADPSRAGAEAEFTESETNTITQFTDPRGRIAIRETDGYGNVRTTTTTREQTKEYTDRLKARLAERDAAAWDREQAANRRKLAYAASETGATSVFDTLMQEASDLEAQAKQKLDHLRETVPREEWKEYQLGPAPEPFKSGVKEILDNLHAGRIDGMAEAIANLGQDEPDPAKREAAGAAARYQLMQWLPEKDRPQFDKMMMKLSIEAGQGHYDGR
jgi:hypothetical protein